MENLANTIASFFVSKGWIDQKFQAWAVYTVQKRMLKSIGMIIFLFVLAALSTWPTAFAFYVGFRLLRSCCNGWHAPHPWLCGLMSLLIVVLLGLIYPHILGFKLVIICLAGLSAVSLIRFAPAESPTLQFTDEERKIHKIHLLQRLSLIAIISAAFLLFCTHKIFIDLALYLLLSVFFTAFGVIAAISCYKNKKGDKSNGCQEESK